MEKVIKKYPSLCYTCEYARRPASEENEEVGWVGCAQYTRNNQNFNFLKEYKKIGEGWVDLRSPIFGKSSGVITNFCLLTCQVKLCNDYQQK